MVAFNIICLHGVSGCTVHFYMSSEPLCMPLQERADEFDDIDAVVEVDDGKHAQCLPCA